MECSRSDIDWAHIREVRARIKSGFYPSPDLIECAIDALHPVVALKDCPPGRAFAKDYQDLASLVVARNIGRVVDYEYVATNFRLPGGQGDAELPLCTECLQDYPLWNDWHQRYGIKSVIVEAKNWSSAIGTPAVGQTLRYLEVAERGHFAILVARNGFSKGAMLTLCKIARANRSLILPLDQEDVIEWSVEHADSFATMRYLRRKETKLTQAA